MENIERYPCDSIKVISLPEGVALRPHMYGVENFNELACFLEGYYIGSNRGSTNGGEELQEFHQYLRKRFGENGYMSLLGVCKKHISTIEEFLKIYREWKDVAK